MVRPRVRQLAALLLVAFVATKYFNGVIHHGWRFDPAATAFYALAVGGVALRLFWARFLTICFCSILAGLTLLRGAIASDLASAELWLQIGPLALAVALLAGRRMQAFFEGRPGCFNRWAGASPRLYRLRWLILVQAVALELLYGGNIVETGLRVPLLALGGAAILGLMFHKTWGLLLAGALCVVEGALAASYTCRALQPLSDGAFLDLRAVFAIVAAIFAVLAVVSFALLAPYLRPIVARLRG
jgi:hypothetical protein